MTVTPGRGPQPCEGMIVAEQPSIDPRAEKMLKTFLRAAGVFLEDIYYTTVVKENIYNDDGLVKRPTLKDIEAWSDVLAGEVQNTAPRAILALGRVAANTLTGLEGFVPWGSRVGHVWVCRAPESLVRTKDRGEYNDSIETMKEWALALR